MTFKQDVRDRVRVMNKHFTNKILIRISGKRFGHFAVLTHTGRKSGKQYRIPIIAEPVENGFVIALTYGKKMDWAANVLAKGGCSLALEERRIQSAQSRIYRSGNRAEGVSRIHPRGIADVGDRGFPESGQNLSA